VGIESMTDEEAIDYLHHVEQQLSTWQARKVRTLAHFHSLRRDVVDAKYAADEIAAALSWAPRIASAQMTTAVHLMERLPETVDAVESGRLDMTKARAILDWTDPLPVEQARQVAATVQEWSIGRTATAVRQKLAREVIKTDPHGAETRRKARLKYRQVSYHKDKDGMACLSVYDSADHLRALYELLDHLARQAKAAGDGHTLDALRADAFASLLAGTKPAPVELRVTIPASVLAGVSNAPGWLHGYGPVTSQHVWELAQQSQFWRRVITDPLTGTVMEVSRRHPSTALRDYVNTRTPTCIGIGCSRPSESCETDHTHDHAAGGPTSADNLGPACRHHNLIKFEGGWTLEQPEAGLYVWTTPTGRRYEVESEPVVEPTPDPIIDDDEPAPF
jgi:hypothetical protein